MKKAETIIAQATPIGRGALALIRLSGQNSREITDRCARLKSKKSFLDIPTHTIHYGNIIEENGNSIDSVLFFIMDAPRSFTGENSIEITCHNNPFIIHNIIKKYIEKGARIALPGEFSERAVLNKKIDLLQAEAINDLLSAQSELETQLALGQVEGTLSHKIHEIDDRISTIAAWCQASFEFLEEERDFTIQILNQVEEAQKNIKILLEQHTFYTLIKQGLKIGILGNTNVGKSSLLNALLKEKKAIVTDIPGTTRDTVEGTMHQDGMYWTFVDTAGIRMTGDLVEQQGIIKSYEIAEQADIILMVFTNEELLHHESQKMYQYLLEKYHKKIILIKNKTDSNDEKKEITLFLNRPFLPISAQYNKNIDLLIEEIKKKKDILFEGKTMSYLINLRHVESLDFADKTLEEVKNLLQKKEVLYEIILTKLHEIEEKLTLMSGKTIEEKSFDKVFRSFCVGK